MSFAGRLAGTTGPHAAVYQDTALAYGWAVLEPIYLNCLLVFTATDIASGVNHSGEPDRNATPLGRREE